MHLQFLSTNPSPGHLMSPQLAEIPACPASITNWSKCRQVQRVWDPRKIQTITGNTISNYIIMAETQSFKQHKRCSNWVPLTRSGSNCVNEAIVIEEHSHCLTKPSPKKGKEKNLPFLLQPYIRLASFMSRKLRPFLLPITLWYVGSLVRMVSPPVTEKA